MLPGKPGENRADEDMGRGQRRAALVMLLLLGGCAADGPEPRKGNENLMGATLNGLSEVPATSTSGRGVAAVEYDERRHRVSWTVRWAGLSGPATAAHFHGPALPGQTAPVALALIPPGTPPVSPLEGSTTLDEEKAADLLAGKWYVNIHTEANPGGEIRGQILPK